MTRFRCAYGACIDNDLKCNGQINCIDESDEDIILCSGIGLGFQVKAIRAIQPEHSDMLNKVGPINLIAPEFPEAKEKGPQTQNSVAKPPLIPVYSTNNKAANTWIATRPGAAANAWVTTDLKPDSASPGSIESLSEIDSFKPCTAPPQPQNGHYKLHGPQCSTATICDVPERTKLQLGSHLIYSCNPGYILIGSADVTCNFEGRWLNIPVCRGM